MSESTLTLPNSETERPDQQNAEEGGGMTYPITPHDLEQDLDGKRDEEVIGITWDGSRCLIAEAIHTHCGLRATVGQRDTWFPDLGGPDGLTLETPDAIAEIVAAFDRLAAHDDDPWAERPVTKRAWKRWYAPQRHAEEVAR